MDGLTDCIDSVDFRTQRRRTELTHCLKPFKTDRLDSCIQKWNTIWTNSQLYIERLKGAEIVLTGLEDSSKFISRLEIQLASSENMPSDPNALKKIQIELTDIQTQVETHQGITDSLPDWLHFWIHPVWSMNLMICTCCINRLMIGNKGVIDQLCQEVGTVRTMVVKSRNAVTAAIRKHPDVDRLEAEVNTVATRWSNICSQVAER